MWLNCLLNVDIDIGYTILLNQNLQYSHTSKID